MKTIIQNQRKYFNSQNTKPVDFRIRMLNRLKDAISAFEPKIFDALQQDLNKSKLDAWSSEIGPCIAEIGYMTKRLKKWTRPKSLGGSMLFPLSKASVVCEPLGLSLIICPWNYPFRLTIMPLIASVAAGNCTIVKPSEISTNTEKVIADMIAEHFDDNYISVICGGPETCTQLLEEKFDHIFYTGNERVGKIVAAAAAKNLTPVTLELGGKSPCVVDKDCDLVKTARRITWGKFVNAGQTCVAPDYLLVHKNIKHDLVTEIKKSIEAFYTADPMQSHDFAKIINQNHFDRITELIKDGDIIIGGQTNRQNLHIAPTLLQNCPPDSKIMNEEIFGPVLPILEYENIEDPIEFINSKPKPLALYIFSRDKSFQQRILNQTSSGGVCINDTIVHLSRSDLPFGGVGSSGHGRYHGKAGIETFSNKKSVFRQTLLFDIPKRFPPTDDAGLKMVRFFIK